MPGSMIYISKIKNKFESSNHNGLSFKLTCSEIATSQTLHRMIGIHIINVPQTTIQKQIYKLTIEYLGVQST